MVIKKLPITVAELHEWLQGDDPAMSVMGGLYTDALIKFPVAEGVEYIYIQSAPGTMICDRRGNFRFCGMIKRILEKERYIGTDNYPKIISAKDYLAVRLKNQEMQSHRTPRLESLKSIGNNIRCSKCGAVLHRHTNAGRARWICANEECREIVNIPDTSLRAEIDRCLTRLAVSPALLAPCAPDEQQVSPDVLRLKNELTAAFNRGSESPEYMRSLIFALAAEQYNALPDMSLIHTLTELQDRIAAKGITEDNRREIEQKAIRRILLSRESGVSIELINGKIISSKEEAEQ